MNILRKLVEKRNWVACLICVNFINVSSVDIVYAKDNITLNLSQTYNGFKLVSEKPLGEINSIAMEFKHIKSGARLLYLKNEDENKVFSINFYTPPSDDKGANHIIEHSVLYGSEKYPVKSPIMQIMKDSVSNYANAITFNDRTEYPFATNNSKDFRNIMGIYMDAVFYPNFRKDPKIFSQEGWCYNLNHKDSDLSYNGVVYNEMKGNYSSPNVILENTIMKSLFPDTLYNYSAGGDPEDIVKLTRDKALETYNKYYTPSNSYIYLYGKIDILDNLKFLDDNYLSKFDKKEINVTIPVQKPFSKRQEKNEDYAVEIGADTKNKTYLSLNYVVNTNVSDEDMLGLQLLNLMMFSSSTSPISREVIKSGLGSSMQGGLNTNLKQPVFQITLSGAEAINKDKYIRTIDSEFNKIFRHGISKQSITSVLSLAEASIRSQKTVGNKGLDYGEKAVSGWMYTGDSTAYLGFEHNLANIKKSVDTDYFNKLIKKYIIDNKHSSLVVLAPRAGLQEENDLKEKKALADYKSKLSKKDVDDLVKQTKELKTWQDKPDSKESIAKMPTLLLSDINTKTKPTLQIEKNIDNVKILNRPLYTNKLAYINMYFDSSRVPQDKLQYVYLLSNILGRVDTDKHKVAEVYKELLNIGGLSFIPIAIPKFKNNEIYYPKFVVECSTLTDNLEKSTNLMGEVINKSKLDDKAQLKGIVKSLKEGFAQTTINSPESIASSRIKSYVSEVGQYNEIGDVKFYDFLVDLDANFDAKAEDTITNLKTVSKLIFNKENLVVGVTIDPDQYNKFEKNLTLLLSKISNKKLETYNYKFAQAAKNEGLAITSQVQYISKGYDINKLGYKYTGSMEVLAKILTTEYLMNEVREKGGTYGSSFSISSQGVAMFSSYRDPKLKETLKAFDKSADFLRSFTADESKMTSYILGLINSKDTLLQPSTKGKSEDYDYISGKTKQDKDKIFNEILNTKAEDIRAFADMIEAITKQNVYCVVGRKDKLNNNKDIFTKVIYDILK